MFARRLTEPERDFLNGDLVAIRGSALGDGAPEFTTLNTLYEVNKEILTTRHGNHYSKTKRPDDQNELTLWEDVESVWTCLLEHITHFSTALTDKSADGDQARKDVRKDYLLGKPLGQRVLASAFLRLTDDGGLSPKKACERLNSVDWRISRKMWVGVLMKPNGNIMTSAALRDAVSFVTYLCGRPLRQGESSELRETFRPEDKSYKLPKRVEPLIRSWGADPNEL